MIVDCYIGSVKVQSDEQAIVQILTNIVGNAINHCPEGATIHVAVFSDDNESIRYVVSDNGTGFSQKIIKNFGMPFNIDVNPMQDNSSTTGLGLSITKKIVTMLQGEITPENNMDGGATVIISLPNYQFDSAAKKDQEQKKIANG